MVVVLVCIPVGNPEYLPQVFSDSGNVRRPVWGVFQHRESVGCLAEETLALFG